MKKSKIFSILTLLSIVMMAILVVVACKKDDEGDDNNNPPAPENPLVGTYAFVSATFNQPITVIVNGDTNNYQAGDDAFIFVGGGLLGAAPCDNADNAALQLRNDFTSWYVCQGEANESQQGTWEPKVNNTVLTLNISDPADFVVNITELILTADKLTGTIPQLPMPYDTSIPVGDPLPGGGINFQIASVSVEFFILD
jgi:hypothetical protein